MRTIAIVNQKGGCGKTTTAINLAAVLARRGRRTLLIDMDPQAHCAAGLGVPESSIERSITDALPADPLDPETTRGLTWEVSRNLDLIPSTMRLAGLEAAGGGLYQLPDRDRRLAALLSHYAGQYDWCLIDCPPTIGLLTYNALRAAGEALIPVETSYFALRGAEKQWKTVQHLASRLNRRMVSHLLPSMHRPTQSLSEEILHSLRTNFPSQLAPVVIDEHESIRQAASFGQPIIEYAPETCAAEQYEALADWLASHEPEHDVYVEVLARQDDVNGESWADVAWGRNATGGGGDHVSPPPETGQRLGGRAAELARRVRELGMTANADAPSSTTPQPPDHGPSESAGRNGSGPLSDEAEQQAGHARNLGAGACVHGVRCDGSVVMFNLPAELGREVAVAGDFNQWSPERLPLRIDPKQECLSARVELPPGRYRYRLVIDGMWRADPYNARQELDANGEPYSVLVIGEVQEAHE